MLNILATDLREVVKESGPNQKYNLVVPDGTWRQARQIFKRNDALQQARKVSRFSENVTGLTGCG
jgi:DTW domain-containing protein YfiP